MDLSSVLVTANKESQKKLTNIEKILAQQLKVDKKAAADAVVKQRREDADKKREAADRKASDNTQKEMLSVMTKMLGHVDEVEEKLNDLEKKTGKGGS